MTREVLSLVTGCLLGSAAVADLSHDFVPVDSTSVLPGGDPLVPDFNDGSYFVFDLVVDVTERFPGLPDDWFFTWGEATISGPAVFFQHPAGGDTPPDPAMFDEFPALEFDSYLSGAPGALVGIGRLTSEPAYIRADWFDTVDFGDGRYPIARFGVHWLGSEPALLSVLGGSGGRDDEGPAWPFEFAVTIPEPSAIALLGMGAVMAAMRRR